MGEMNESRKEDENYREGNQMEGAMDIRQDSKNLNDDGEEMRKKPFKKSFKDSTKVLTSQQIKHAEKIAKISPQNYQRMHKDHEKLKRQTLNLRLACYAMDCRPLVENCKCITCRDHTRAYIHHLLNAKEMLGEVLLYIHNYYHYLLFFHNIRKNIAADTFRGFYENFQTQFDPQ